MGGRFWIACGSAIGGLGVVIGTIAAHPLEQWLQEVGRAETFETAVHYQMFHALAMLCVGLFTLPRSSRVASLAGWAFMLGVVLFCFGIYAYIATFAVESPAAALWGKRIVMIVPFGGVSFIFGWTCLALAACWMKPERAPM